MDDETEYRDLRSAEAAMQRKDDNRVVYWFDVPKGVAPPGKEVKRVGLIELTSSEELMCTKRAASDPVRLAFELAKECLRYVDDRIVHSGDGSSDTFWGQQGMSKLRQCIMAAYGEIHNPKQNDVASFLASRKASA